MTVFKRERNKINRMMDKLLKEENQGIVKKSHGTRAFRKLINNRMAMIGLCIFVLILILCYGAPLFSQFNPRKFSLAEGLLLPGGAHLLGTDRLGRDVFTRILYGGQVSIFIGLGSAIGAAVVGMLLGAYSGYRGGLIDSILLRISEMFMSFPQIILVLLLVTILGQSMWNIIFIFIVTGWSSVYRLTRSQMLSLREEEYVQALKVFGLNRLVICYKHILPNAIGPIIVNLTLNTALFILQETALSFLGLGIPIEIPSWGNIINVANDIHVLQTQWWIWLPVGFTISIFVLSINFIGDGLRDSTDASMLE